MVCYRRVTASRLEGGLVKFLCKIFRHKLMRAVSSPNGELEKLFCWRYKRYFALHHPTEWFGDWDWEDQQTLQMYFDIHYAPKGNL